MEWGDCFEIGNVVGNQMGTIISNSVSFWASGAIFHYENKILY